MKKDEVSEKVNVGLRCEIRTTSREEDEEYLNGREKRCSRITPLMQIFSELTFDGK